MKIAFISTFDSFLRASKILAGALGKFGAECSHIILKTRLDQISDSQIDTILDGSPHSAGDFDLVFTMLAESGFDWIILSAENSSCRKFFDRFARQEFKQPRPLVGTIYPGIIFRHHYDGFSARMPADLVILNSHGDHYRYSRLRKAYGFETGNAYAFGPVTNLGASPATRKPGGNLVVFYDQPSVPKTREEKFYLFQELSRLAGKHPDFDFRLKLRINPNDSTLHQGGEQAAGILRESNAALPEGGREISTIQGDTRAIIARSALSLSVSSTALVESLACGCPAAAISDFGIDEEYGVSFFIGSDVISRLPEIDPAVPPRVDCEWIADNIGATVPDPAALFQTMCSLLSSPPPQPGIGACYGTESFLATMSRKLPRDKVLARVYRNSGSRPLLHKITDYVVKFVLKRFK